MFHNLVSTIRTVCVAICILLMGLVSYAYAQTSNCVNCHQQQVSNWEQSDHAKAMAIASKDTVLGNFNHSETTHYSQRAVFYTDGATFKIDLTEDNKTTTYQVAYTFGHFPLQQYLVPAKGGRYQIFPFAWDSRSKAEGGQRWYPNYQSEDLKSNDRLHWQQSLQNWNGMCADCHSDGLKRNFEAKNNKFDTQWDNINVGCQSCHGNMESHATNLNKPPQDKIALINSSQQTKKVINWLLSPNEAVATLKNKDGKLATTKQKKARQKSMDTCFSCHALRSPLTDGFAPNKSFLEQFSPSLISQPLYHADGQIKEEVYVYGSFLQSKMFKEGVTCIDCHDAHSMKVKAQDNSLCLQCHNAVLYQQEKHTGHSMDSEAGQCVTCHMPESTFMGVDDRRDHSFKIPRPDLSIKYNTPNACLNCHKDQDNQWAESQLKQLHGDPETLSRSEQDFIILLKNQNLDFARHIALINDTELNEIKRASALMLLLNTRQNISNNVITPWVNSEYPLIRLATAKIGYLLSNKDKQLSYKKLLSDEYKSIRVATAEHLLGLGFNISKQALNEVLDVQKVDTWQGEGNLKQSLMWSMLGKKNKAIESLEYSINIDPYFASAYINLAELYRSSEESLKEKQLYKLALSNMPNDASIRYAYGLFLIRIGDKLASVHAFKKALTLQPENPQYAYLYLLALDATGKTKQALTELKRKIKHDQSKELIQLGMNFSRKINDKKSYYYFAEKNKQQR